MNFFKISFSLLAASVISVSAFAQTALQKQQITKSYDQTKLSQFAEKQARIFTENREKAIQYAQLHNLPIVIEKEDGQKSYLFRLDRFGNPQYITTRGKKAARTISTDKVYPNGGMGLSLEGEGMTIGIWDAGMVKTTHELLSGQATQKDAGNGPSPNHATHVTGIAIGKDISGGGSQARGMAYKADAITYDWNNDFNEMTQEAQEGLLVSNHSYGMDLEQVSNPMIYLGVYDEISEYTDQLASMAPYYTMVTAAGNDRGVGYNPTENGYNLLAGWMSTAKNDIVVAAIDLPFIYIGPSSVEMSYFSSWGPTNDNRVKPDLSAQGVDVFSSLANSNTSYGNLSGTSMASPGIAGSILLLQELSSDLNNGNFLKSATVKAIAINSVRETGINPGPDPSYGWGLFNTEGAAQLIIDNHEEVNSYYDELQLNEDKDTYSVNVKANNDGEITATVVWLDPAGSELVNDLDLRITDANGNTFYPWRLDATDYSAPALNDGDNSVDNVEKVWVENATPGATYTITVTHKGSLESGEQDFSIAVTGIQNKPLSTKKQELQGISLYPNPAQNEVNLNLDQSGNNIEIIIYDFTGKQVKNFALRGNNANQHRLDVSSLHQGVYFVNIKTDGKQATKKLIIR